MVDRDAEVVRELGPSGPLEASAVPAIAWSKCPSSSYLVSYIQPEPEGSSGNFSCWLMTETWETELSPRVRRIQGYARELERSGTGGLWSSRT
jgi:hypothetical protein